MIRKRQDSQRHTGELGISTTTPRGGATAVLNFGAVSIHISIHAPRGGSDSVKAMQVVKQLEDFNPRPPWGERRIGQDLVEG